jgi:uncharacterized coiled-coil DUF342 family protein
METREIYKQKFEAQIHEWSAKIDALTARADKLTAEAKLEVKPHIDAVHDKLDAAKAKLHELGEATDDGWNDVKKNADSAWSDVKAAVEGAYDALKPRKHDKKPS